MSETYEIIVLDLDGTLTNSKKVITPKTKDALMRIQKEGKKVVLASGRPTGGIVKLADELDLKSYGGFVLAFNGGKIINYETGEIVYNKTIPVELVPAVYEQACRLGVGVLTYKGNTIIHGNGVNEYSSIEAKINGMPIKEVDNFAEYVDYPVNKFLMTGEPEKIAKAQDVMRQTFGEQLNIFRSEPFFLEIVPPSIDKAYSLGKLLEYLGEKKEQMICCGDGFNDKSMIAFAGLGVAMANAQPEVKEVADYITTSNDEDGVALVYRQIHVRKAYGMQKITELLSKGKSPYHVTEWTGKQLQEAGYEELKLQESWQLHAGGKYYVRPYSGMVAAFAAPEQLDRKTALRLMLAHTDFPCFKIKPNPEVKTKDYRQLNVEPYGGMLKNTWFDRPLGIYGKVVLESEHPFAPEVKLFGSEEPAAVIPSLAPHLNREAGGKQEYDMQRELLPLLGIEQDGDVTENFFTDYLKEQLGAEANEVLSYDLFLTNMDEPELIGSDKKLLSSPRIDNLASVAAIVETMCEKTTGDSLVVAGLFDNEEIGSRSKQGADSSLLKDIIMKIGAAFGMAETEVNDMLRGGFLLSIDGAHAVHPNYTNKSDITNDVILGKGITVKTSASQRYLSDSEATAVVMQLCKKTDIPYQVQVNRSGMPGGQTLGPIVVSYLPMQGADIGIPMLAMHSARELADMRDYQALVMFLKIFSA